LNLGFVDGRRWRNRRLHPKSAFPSFPPVRGADIEGSLRVEFTRSLSRRGTTGICAKRTTGIAGFVARTIARFWLTGKMAHDDLVCPATSSRLQSSGTPSGYVLYTLSNEHLFAPRGQRIEDAVRSRSDYV
jgi:hypothetical protein